MPRGQSARDPRTFRQASPRYLFGWMWDPLIISLFLLTPSRDERSSCARPAGFPFPSISLLRPPNLDSSRRNLPRHLLHLPQTLDRLLPGRNHPHHRQTPLEVLEACSTVDPPLRSSSTRTDRGNGFVVSSLCFTAFFSPSMACRRRRSTASAVAAALAAP